MSRFRTRLLAVTGSVLLSVALLSGCSLVQGSSQLVDDALQEQSASPSVPAPALTAWSYEGATGPEAWGGLSDEFAACEIGDAQSPVDLPRDPAPGSGIVSVVVNEPVTAGEASDTGRTGEFVPDHDAQSVEYGGVRYELDQLHFHVPAEHTVGGESFDAEFHFVHRSADGDLLVLALMAKEGAVNPLMQPFIENATAGSARDTAFDLASILPGDSAAWSYTGSLTTPPCSEGVRWMVLQQPITLSAAQLDQLESLHGANARSVQPLGGRVVSEDQVNVSRG